MLCNFSLETTILQKHSMVTFHCLWSPPLPVTGTNGDSRGGRRVVSWVLRMSPGPSAISEAHALQGGHRPRR